MTKHSAGYFLRKVNFQISAVAALALISPSFLPSHTRVSAREHDKSATKDKVVVLAHVPLPGSAVRQIFSEEENGKRYLILQQNVHFTVLDVSDPKNPKIVDRVAGKGRVADVGAGLAISVQSDQPIQANVATSTVRLVDMSDPKNPRVVKTLTGVTSVYSEDGRQLIYMTNNDGLWVIKHFETFRLPYCTTESSGDPVAQCQ